MSTNLTFAPDYGETVSESITITDNRTGESVEIPIENGAVDSTEWRKLLPGCLLYTSPSPRDS